MPRHDEEDDYGIDDDPGDDEDDFDDGGNVEQTIACPYCGRTIHEDAQQCPGCGNYISEEDAPPSRKPWWIVVGVLICLFLVYQWIARGP